jgi:hypothetical protein
MAVKTVTKPQLRSFGLIVAGGFAVIGLWPAVWRGQPPRVWAVVISAVLAVVALTVPSMLRSFHRVWMMIGEALGWVNSRIILSLVYYVLIVPVAVVRRLVGSDPMRRRFDRDAARYRIARCARPASHMKRQY